MERKRLGHLITAAVTILGGPAGVAYLLDRGTPPAQAAEPPKPNSEQANPAFNKHLEGRYQDEQGFFQIRRSKMPVVELSSRSEGPTPVPERCHDSDVTEEFSDGNNPQERGTMCAPYIPGVEGSPACITDYCLGYSAYEQGAALVEFFCGADGTPKSTLHSCCPPGFTTSSVEEFIQVCGPLCQNGRCVENGLGPTELPWPLKLVPEKTPPPLRLE